MITLKNDNKANNKLNKRKTKRAWMQLIRD